MKRLLMMLGYQLLFLSLAGAFLGAVIFGVSNWEVTKAVLLGVMPLLALAGTAVGYAQGRPRATNAGKATGTRVVRGLAGALVGMVVFSMVGFALGILAFYVHGLVADPNWFTILENWLPAVGTAGGGVGLVVGYLIAH